MPAQITTKAQVNGHRFLLRRLQHALVRGDSRMIHDPMRGQMRSILVGAIIALLVAASALVLAFFKPVPNFGQSTIMFSKSDGALYVRIGDRLHPTLNLASARLIVGKSDQPNQVDNKFLNTVPRGPSVGVVGAPNGLHGGDDMNVSSWSVCDVEDPGATSAASGGQTAETFVLGNDPALADGIRAATDEDAILTKSGDTTFLIYDGVRASIDIADPVLAAAFGLDDSSVRNVSSGLLNAFPLVDPIQPITIDGAGTPTNFLPNAKANEVGSLLRTVDSQGEQLWVVLRDGVQPVSSAAADVIRYSNPGSTASEPVDIAPALLNDVPERDTLSLAHFPEVLPKVADIDVVCMSWRQDNADAEPTTSLLIGSRLPVPDDTGSVRLATADGSGPAVDGVYLRPGTGEYVQGTGPNNATQLSGRLFYVSDVGIRYSVPDESTASALGLVGITPPGGGEQRPQPAPWPVLSLLPPGPELSQQAALVAHDGMPGDPDSRPVTPPDGG